MEFRLVYTGEVNASQDRSAQKPDPRRENKHRIRTAFHLQLRRLWEVTDFLDQELQPLVPNGEYVRKGFGRKTLAELYRRDGFDFVPLVTKFIDPICEVGILMLRSDGMGPYSGDLDNRVKTIVDALSIPTVEQRYDQRQPAPGETPFYCVLENDRLITKLSVETDRFLCHPGSAPAAHMVHAIITIRFRPRATIAGCMF